MSAIELARASFRGSILVRTDFSKSGLTETRFADVALMDVKLRDDRPAAHGLRALHLHRGGLQLLRSARPAPGRATFTSVRFDRAALEGVTFRGATLRMCPSARTSRKYRTAIRTVAFDGARMDKLTYAGLKGMGADLSNVTVE